MNTYTIEIELSQTEVLTFHYRFKYVQEHGGMGVEKDIIQNKKTLKNLLYMVVSL